MHERLLTLRQPYADLAVAGIKSPENRSWRVPSTLPQWYRCVDGPVDGEERWIPEPWDWEALGPCDEPDGPFPFRVYIHAGLAYADNVPDWIEDEVDRLAWRDPERYAVCVTGAVVGSVLVTGCHHADECYSGTDGCACWACAGGLGEHQYHCTSWAEPDTYHWTLVDAVRFDSPIPWTGGLGLRHVPDDLRDLITQQTGDTP